MEFLAVKGQDLALITVPVHASQVHMHSHTSLKLVAVWTLEIFSIHNRKMLIREQMLCEYLR